jgi:triosephosphate isomerase
MLMSVGCKYVLVGHSERRTLFQENNTLINQKLKTALAEGLHPILCVGESLEQRDADKTEEIIANQLQEGLNGLSSTEMKKMTIAYEPIWAIGTGVNAKPEQAQRVHEVIRKKLNSMCEPETVQEVRVIYGGSVTPDNSSSLLAQPDVDGALVGGASLDADSFYAIINSIK